MTEVKPRGVAFTGKMGSGKSTCARFLREKLSCDSTNYPFAEPLKKAVADVLVAAGYDTSVMLKKELRPCYQAIGHGLREFWSDIWVETTRGRIRETPLDTLITNDDCRYPNEVDMLREEGFYIVRLEASEELRGQRIELSGTEHESETALDGYPSTKYHSVINQDNGHVTWVEKSGDNILLQSDLISENPSPEEIVESIIYAANLETWKKTEE